MYKKPIYIGEHDGIKIYHDETATSGAVAVCNSPTVEGFSGLCTVKFGVGMFDMKGNKIEHVDPKYKLSFAIVNEPMLELAVEMLKKHSKYIEQCTEN